MPERAMAKALRTYNCDKIAIKFCPGKESRIKGVHGGRRPPAVQWSSGTVWFARTQRRGSTAFSLGNVVGHIFVYPPFLEMAGSGGSEGACRAGVWDAQ